jgi:hypothetical protein
MDRRRGIGGRPACRMTYACLCSVCACPHAHAFSTSFFLSLPSAVTWLCSASPAHACLAGHASLNSYSAALAFCRCLSAPPSHLPAVGAAGVLHILMGVEYTGRDAGATQIAPRACLRSLCTIVPPNALTILPYRGRGGEAGRWRF